MSYKNLIKKDPGTLPRRKDDDPFFAIWRHYHDTDFEMILSDSQKERVDIYEKAHELCLSGFSRGETAKNLQVFFKEKGVEFSIRSAYDYLQDALDLWGAGPESDMTMNRMILIETGKRLMKKSEKLGDMKSAAAFFAQIVKLHPIPSENADLIDKIKALKPHSVILSTDPEILRKQAQELTQDIDHEDISEENA
jgi:hypothetical protein